jgi:hypothetical protein
MQQLHLFKGKKQRGVKLPPAPEFNLHVMVANILHRWGSKDWDWTHLPFGEHRSAKTGARLKRMGTKRGWPDFILFAPREHKVEGQKYLRAYGRVYCLELKRKGAKLSDEQKNLMFSLIGKGHSYDVADNFADALTILKRWGAVRATVSA